MIRAQVAAGRSDEEIRAFLVSRYGDFILLRPRFSPATVILWVGPFAIVLIGLGVLVSRRRKAGGADVAADGRGRGASEVPRRTFG